MRDLQSYYFSFESTGCDEVDSILESVCSAGHASHHTDGWDDQKHGDERTHIEIIQARADLVSMLIGVKIAEISKLNTIIENLQERIEDLEDQIENMNEFDFGE